MAIAFDATGTGEDGGAINQSSLIFAHNQGASNPLLTVGVALWQNTNGVGSVGTITYAGNNLTRQVISSTSAMRSELWTLVNPPTGNASVVVNYVRGSILTIKSGSISFTGVDQSTPVEATARNEGFSSVVTASITTLTDGAFVVDAFSHFGTESFTVGASQTSKWASSVNSISGGGSYAGPQSPAGLVTMTWRWPTTARDWTDALIAIKPLATTAPFTNNNLKELLLIAVGK